MNNPLMSICIPVYNRPDLIKRTLDSCINQTYWNIEIVVVDDASTDNTYKVIKSYAARDPKIKVYRNEKNLGMIPNWKRTFELATGDYIQHLGSDDALSRDFVEKKMEIFARYPDVAFVGCAIRTHIADPTRGIRFLNETKHPAGEYSTEYVLKNFYRKPALISTGCTVRRSDMLKHFTVTIPNKWGYDEIYTKRGKIMDNLVFLEILTQYHSMYYLNDVFYESLEHPRNDTKLFSGLVRGSIADHITFVHMDQVGFSYFYQNYAPKYLSRYRTFVGSEVLSNTLFDLALGRAKGSPWAALGDFFSEYSPRERFLSWAEFPLSFIRRMYEWVLRKMNAMPLKRL